jgi:hypothetical protein
MHVRTRRSCTDLRGRRTWRRTSSFRFCRRPCLRCSSSSSGRPSRTRRSCCHRSAGRRSRCRTPSVGAGDFPGHLLGATALPVAAGRSPAVRGSQLPLMQWDVKVRWLARGREWSTGPG